MCNLRKLTISLTILILFLGTSAAQDFSWQGDLTSGQSIEIKGTNGWIHAEPSLSGNVEVTADKKSRRSSTDSVRIEVVEHFGGVTICAVYPDVDDKPNICAPGDGGRLSNRNNDVTVNFTVRVPVGVNFTGKTANGEIKARSLPGDASTFTVNGSIEVSADGVVEARTVNGSIYAEMGSTDWDDTLEFATVNGSITVVFGDQLSAEFAAQTVNGDIETDFPVSGRLSRKQVRGTIGTGERELSLKTVNGSIRLRQGI